MSAFELDPEDRDPRIDGPSLRKLLSGPSPRRILERLIDGDPLGVEAQALERARELAYLLDEERLPLRALARVAHAAPHWCGEPPLEEWLAECIDRAIEDLREEDRQDDRERVPIEPPWEPRFALLAECLGTRPQAGLGLCVRMNDLPLPVRRTFFALVLERKRFNRWVAEGHGPPARVRKDLKQAFRRLGLPFDPTTLDDLPDEDDRDGPGEDELGAGGEMP